MVDQKELLNRNTKELEDSLKKAAVGLKYDNNKPSLSLIDPSFLEGLAKVLDFGKEKYGAHNWRSGISVSRLISAIYRHLGEINRGSDLDSESGLPHVYHLASNVMFLAWILENRKEFDDRYKPTNTRLAPSTLRVGDVPKIGEPYWVENPNSRPLSVGEYNYNKLTWNLGDNPA